jgi:hypothetical protein
VKKRSLLLVILVFIYTLSIAQGEQDDVSITNEHSKPYFYWISYWGNGLFPEYHENELRFYALSFFVFTIWEGDIELQWLRFESVVIINHTGRMFTGPFSMFARIKGGGDPRIIHIY